MAVTQDCIWLTFENEIDGQRRILLPEPRSYFKREKESFSWAKNQSVKPLPGYFSNDIEMLVAVGNYSPIDVIELGFQEEWFDAACLLSTVRGLLDTARRAESKLPTVKYLVCFLEALEESTILATRHGERVHLSAGQFSEA